MAPVADPGFWKRRGKKEWIQDLEKGVVIRLYGRKPLEGRGEKPERIQDLEKGGAIRLYGWMPKRSREGVIRVGESQCGQENNRLGDLWVYTASEASQ